MSSAGHYADLRKVGKGTYEGKYFLVQVPDHPKMQEGAASVDVQFLQRMVNRIIMSHFKYGPAKDQYPEQAQALPNIYERVKMYEETGNTEWLVDAANFSMLEYMFPSHPDAHFRETDSDESPGIV